MAIHNVKWSGAHRRTEGSILPKTTKAVIQSAAPNKNTANKFPNNDWLFQIDHQFVDGKKYFGVTELIQSKND